MFYSETRSEMGWGLGTHMVFVPDPGGRTSPFPAMTMHFGDRGNELFIGALFMPSDRIRFPNGGGRYRIEEPRNDAYPDFILENARGWHWKRPTLYMGIQIGGVRVSERSAQEADEAGSSAVIRIELDSAVVGSDSVVRLEVNENIPLKTRVVGTNDRTLNVPVRWSTEDASVARILENNSVLGVKADTTYLSASVGGIAKRYKVIVTEKEDEAEPAEPETETKPEAGTPPELPGGETGGGSAANNEAHPAYPPEPLPRTESST